MVVPDVPRVIGPGPFRLAPAVQRRAALPVHEKEAAVVDVRAPAMGGVVLVGTVPIEVKPSTEVMYLTALSAAQATHSSSLESG